MVELTSGRVVLASASPRRLDLLRRIGVEPVVMPAHIDETARPGESAQALVGRLASAKAEAVDVDPGLLVIAADTVVVLDGEILGKPGGHAEAEMMLRRLGGRTHAVMTGIACRREGQTVRAVVRTEVTFRHLTMQEVVWYVATGESHDKAGGYGIQGAAGAFVTSVVGSDTNVVGLPLSETITLARQVGIDLLA